MLIIIVIILIVILVARSLWIREIIVNITIRIWIRIRIRIRIRKITLKAWIRIRIVVKIVWNRTIENIIIVIRSRKIWRVKTRKEKNIWITIIIIWIKKNIRIVLDLIIIVTVIIWKLIVIII